MDNKKRYSVAEENVKILAEAAAKTGYKVLDVRGGLVEDNEVDKLDIAVEKNGLKALVEYNDKAIKPYKTGKSEFSTFFAALGYISENAHRYVNNSVEDSFQKLHMEDEMKHKKEMENRSVTAKKRFDEECEKHDGLKIMKSIMTEEELKRGFQLNR